MDMQTLLSKAIRIAAVGFDGKFDKSGVAYIMHCFEVMNRVHTIRQKILAMLHDTVEDGVITFQQLREEGFPEDVIQDVILLTHIDDEDYLDVYIKKIAHSDDASVVKMADLDHNSNLARLKGIGKKDLDRAEKYQKAYLYLSRR